MDMKLPMEYLTDHLFNIHPAEEFDADGFKNYGTAWLHGKDAIVRSSNFTTLHLNTRYWNFGRVTTREIRTTMST